jgi:hypothetical protein
MREAGEAVHRLGAIELHEIFMRRWLHSREHRSGVCHDDARAAIGERGGDESRDFLVALFGKTVDYLQRIGLDRRDVERRHQRVETRAQDVVGYRPFPHEKLNENICLTISSQQTPSSGRSPFRQQQEPLHARSFSRRLRRAHRTAGVCIDHRNRHDPRWAAARRREGFGPFIRVG